MRRVKVGRRPDGRLSLTIEKYEKPKKGKK